MQRVLLVDDSIEYQMEIERAFSGCNLQFTKASSLKEATGILHEKSKEYFDLILLDIVLPDGDGLSLFREKKLNALAQNTPVFLLTSKTEVASKVEAFDLGVDDYLVKPVSFLELKARVITRLKKVLAHKQNTMVIRRGELSLDVPLLKATKSYGGNEQDLELTSKEFKILYFLMRHEGVIFPRNKLVQEIWGEGVHVLERTVDSHISSLRRKLGSAGKYVESVSGKGYRFSVLARAAGASVT